ncbi:MAG TPA: glutathione S-transferase [Pseudolabrys sp.]|nr:glutathione S-transferase [Pseudolabrys sp.]
MAEFELYCFAQSGNCYRAALMLNLIGADWKPVWVDFFGAMIQRTPEFRADVNEMGEAPVLVHGDRKLSQSGVILTYLARLSGKFRPKNEEEELEALRWIIFDNQKVNGFLGPFRFLKNFAKPAGDEKVLAFLKGRAEGNLSIVDKRLSGREFLVSDRPTIADVSMTGYLYYPAAEFGFDIASQYPSIGAWLQRMKALPGWKPPYELMPGYPLRTN